MGMVEILEESTTGQSWSIARSDGSGMSGRRGYKWCRKAVPEGGE